ncbi:MAG TPA: efflux RND transporter periplasmic adaptor subunit [Steroidobacteraceae bacterium]|nr:efflux RND transporter periplasmic adaptor subunit [Steroidobacteraceae bacterium]
MRLIGAEERREKAQEPAPEAARPRRRIRRVGGYGAIAGAAVLALLAAWWFMRRPVPPEFLTAPVTRGTVARAVTATGTVNPVMTIIVGSYVSGVIRDVYCDYNTRVKKGQLCARIDPRPYQAALEQARGQLARDSAQLAGARVDLARYAVLVQQNSVARITYTDQAALVHQLEGSVQLDRALVSNAEVNLGYTSIVSPVDGTVVARNITIGQTVAASFQTPTLFLIATDLTRMQVDTNTSESDIGSIAVGAPADFTVEAYPDRIFHGSIVQVRQAPQVVQNVVTYDAVVGVDNPSFLLKPGMTATVSIVTTRRTNVLRIPDQALRFTPNGLTPGQPGGAPQGAAAPSVAATGAVQSARLWVLRQGKAVAVPVRVGLDDGTYSELVSGDLQADDRVIIGEQRVGAGQPARVFRFPL